MTAIGAGESATVAALVGLGFEAAAGEGRWGCFLDCLRGATQASAVGLALPGGDGRPHWMAWSGSPMREASLALPARFPTGRGGERLVAVGHRLLWLGAAGGVVAVRAPGLPPFDGRAARTLGLVGPWLDRSLALAGAPSRRAESEAGDEPMEDRLRRQFDLTPTESRVAAMIVHGRGLFEAAGLMGITRNTARTHMKRIYAKTGARRSADLVRVLAAGRLAGAP